MLIKISEKEDIFTRLLINQIALEQKNVSNIASKKCFFLFYDVHYNRLVNSSLVYQVILFSKFRIFWHLIIF